jgi:ankyrin repeat protein
MHNITLIGLTLLLFLIITPDASASDIHDAIKANDADKVRSILAEDKLQANAINEKGSAPLHLACYKGHEEIVDALLEAGADIEIHDGYGCTPIRWAVQGYFPEIVKQLIDKGADISGEHPLFGSLIDQAFVAACQKHAPPAITNLLLSMAQVFNPEKIDKRGMSRLHWTTHFGNFEMARFAVDQGAPINFVRKRDGKTPLADATSRGYTDIAALLVEHGADPTIIDAKGHPPLRYAVESGHIEIAELLLSHGASISYIDNLYGRGFLHLAAINGYKNVAELLVEGGCDLNIHDNNGKSPVYYALKYGNRSLANYLTSQGADANTDLPKEFENSELINSRPEKETAVAWYLNNRGWAVKTSDHMLVFDYEEFMQKRPTEPSLANGFINLSEIENHNLCVLYTFYHGDQGEMGRMHSLEDSLKNVAYVHNIDDPWRGCNNSFYLGPNDTLIHDQIDILAVRPTSPNSMPTNAYLCQVDDLTVYYAGAGTDDINAFKQALDSLSGHVDKVDIALLPIPEPGEEEDSDFHLFLETFQPNAVCLLDPNRREHIFKDIAAKVAEWGIKTHVFCAENPGDHFVYQAGK